MASETKSEKDPQNTEKNRPYSESDYLDPLLEPTIYPSYNLPVNYEDIYFYKSFYFSERDLNFIHKSYLYKKISLTKYSYGNLGIKINKKSTIFDNVLYQPNKMFYYSPSDYYYDFSTVSDSVEVGLKTGITIKYRPYQKYNRNNINNINRAEKTKSQSIFDPSISLGSKRITFLLNLKDDTKQNWFFDKTSIAIGKTYTFWNNESPFFVVMRYDISEKSGFFASKYYSKNNYDNFSFGLNFRLKNKKTLSFTRISIKDWHSDFSDDVFIVQFAKNF